MFIIMSVLYNDPIFIKAVNNLSEDDVKFFKDIQEWKIDLKNKKDLKKRLKKIELKMVSNFNFQEIRRFIKVMYYITLEQKNKKKLDLLRKEEENDKIWNN